MAMVLIRCPNTNLPVTTGIFMDRLAFESADFPVEERRLNCTLCQEVHVWQKDEAYLVEDEEMSLAGGE
jgi:nitrate reductase cytochrome c-type subunit